MKVLFAAGGSAGHVDPALATARQLDAEILFAGNQSGIEKKLVQRANFQFQHIPKLAFPRSFSLRNLLWPVRAFIVLFKAISISSKVDVIVGFGGYVSAYFYLAGFLLRKPVIAHEANALPGISTKLARKLGADIYTLYPLGFGEQSALPVIGGFGSTNISVTEVTNRFGLDQSRPTVLVLGGSLGAVRLNRAIIDLIKENSFSDWNVLHSIGSHGFGEIENPPVSTNNYHWISYIEDMSTVLPAVDLVITRAGAGMCVQCTLSEVPAIFVPLPVGNGEQGKNADPIVRAGAAMMVEDDVNLNQNLRRALNEIDVVAMKNNFKNVPDFLKKSDGAIHFAKIIQHKLGANESI